MTSPERLLVRQDRPNPPEPAQARTTRLSRRFLSAIRKKRGASVGAAVDVGLTRTERLGELRRWVDAGEAVAWTDVADLLEMIGQLEKSWRLVERYCESFARDDFRLVFRRADEIVEIEVGKEAFEVFGTKP